MTPKPTDRIAAELSAVHTSVRQAALDGAGSLVDVLERGYANDTDKRLCMEAAECLNMVQRLSAGQLRLLRAQMGEE